MGLLACGIVGSTLWSQSRAASGIAYSDQWAWVAQYSHIVEHGLDLDGLMAQNNEHRLVFPRLVFLLDMILARGSDRLNLLFSDALLASIFAMLAWKGREALRSPIGIVAALATVAFLGNAIQQEDLYWGFQVQFVMVYAAAVASFALLSTADDRGPTARLRLASCWAMATVATFSMANGILTWPILCLVLAWRNRRRAAACTFGIGAVELATYLHGYHGVASAQHTGIVQAVMHPAACVSYFLVYLGGLLAPTDPDRALAGGCGLLAAGAAFAGWARRHGAGSGPWRAFAGSVALFVVASAVLTTIGRFSLGDEQALSGRYLTPGALLWSTLLMAMAVEARRALSGRRSNAACLALASAVALIAVLDQRSGIDAVDQATLDFQQAADAYAVGVRDDGAMSAVTDDHDLAWSVRPFLAEHRLGPFGATPASELGGSTADLYGNERYGPCIGSLDRTDAISGPPGRSGSRIYGWVWGVTDGLPSAVVVADADGRIVGFARTGQDRADLARSHPGGASRRAGFAGYVREGARGPLTVFAVSNDGRKLCPVRGTTY